MVVTSGTIVVLGVKHVPENLQPTINALQRLSFSSIGIELPERYRQSSAEGRLNFFEELAAAMRNRGVRVVPLDSRELRDLARKAILHPNENPELDEWAIHEQRSRHMLEVIRMEDVTVAVIGAMHFADMKEELPEYEYKMVAGK